MNVLGFTVSGEPPAPASHNGHTLPPNPPCLLIGLGPPADMFHQGRVKTQIPRRQKEKATPTILKWCSNKSIDHREVS